MTVTFTVLPPMAVVVMTVTVSYLSEQEESDNIDSKAQTSHY